MTTYHDYKVLPFDGAQGHVPGHEIRCYNLGFTDRYNQPDPIEFVLFDTFDQTANMPIEILIHWTRWTEYTKRMWPKGGSTKAVVLKSGRRIAATSYSLGWNFDEEYDNAPIVCRDIFKICMMGCNKPMLEVVGVAEWRRTGNALVDPWQRDNEESRKRMGETA